MVTLKVNSVLIELVFKKQHKRKPNRPYTQLPHIRKHN